MTDTVPQPPAGPIHVARAELRLAAPSETPLRAVPLSPDPLGAIAAAVADVRPELGEDAQIIIDLLPLTPGRARYHKKRAQRAAEQQLQPGASAFGSLSEQLRMGMEATRGVHAIKPTAPPRRAPAARGSAQAAARFGKYTPEQPLFAVQILIRVTSQIPGRAQGHLKAILSAFNLYDGANYWRAAGLNLGPAHIGSDSVLYRRSFERRFESGLFAPRHESVVTGAEIAGLLKPPTKHCAPRNVMRSGGLVPPAPRELPTYELGSSTLVPLGYVTAPDGTDKLAGAPLTETLFELILGKSGNGKTELMLAQALALAHGGHGTWFLDPHRDAAKRALPYLAHPHIAPRVWDIDLTVRSGTDKICNWNPLSMEGRSRDDIPDVVGAITSAVASALGWGESSNRALTILTKACEALANLSLKLTEAGRPDIAPTVFQIVTLLTDEEWREKVIGYIDKEYARFWTRTFPNYPQDAVPVVTNALERIATSRAAKAFLGGSRSTYDVRRAMDTGRIVFVCPAGNGPTDRLVSCLMIFDLFRAGLSRRDIPPQERKAFFSFVDELTGVDGAAKGTLAAIVEQLRKFMVRLMAATQMASRLTTTTRDALMQNQSILSTTATEADAARLVGRQWGSQVDPETLTSLPRYTHVMSITLNGAVSSPFKVRGAEIGELFRPLHRPDDVPKLERAIDENLKRRTLQEILDEQAELDDRISAFLPEVRIEEPAKAKGGSAPRRGTGAPGSVVAAEPQDLPGGEAGGSAEQPAPQPGVQDRGIE